MLNTRKSTPTIKTGTPIKMKIIDIVKARPIIINIIDAINVPIAKEMLWRFTYI